MKVLHFRASPTLPLIYWFLLTLGPLSLLFSLILSILDTFRFRRRLGKTTHHLFTAFYLISLTHDKQRKSAEFSTEGKRQTFTPAERKRERRPRLPMRKESIGHLCLYFWLFGRFVFVFFRLCPNCMNAGSGFRWLHSCWHERCSPVC